MTPYQHIKQALAHERAAKTHDDKQESQMKSAGAAMFAAIQTAAEMDGKKAPPTDPIAFEHWRKGHGKDLPSYDAALEEANTTRQSAAYLVQWHVDPDAAMLRRVGKIAASTKLNIANKEKQAFAAAVQKAGLDKIARIDVDEATDRLIEKVIPGDVTLERQDQLDDLSTKRGAIQEMARTLVEQARYSSGERLDLIFAGLDATLKEIGL